MRQARKIAVLALALSLPVLISGCPGMPGAGGRQAENLPPGMLPPPGVESGGARTLMGTTITPPENSYLLIKYTRGDDPAASAEWRSCRRFIPLETAVLIEGLNYDGCIANEDRDVNQLLPFAGLASFYWKYEARPAPPAESEPKPSQGRRGR